ncbi:Flp family type IVb pilin [Parvibaculum sp.]|uniref:Flp family type IVb pilin n=1 Tax=Parvibaculum sp. TaxID=2024848 RepID=UPI000C8A309A|nr:Flp family type IVb pilin [Parvibaculum sp.]MAB14997.1 Flp family type IVb pilin [Parvibaculum sp.]
MTEIFARFGRDEGGATAIEYALIASLIAVAISSTVYTLGGTVMVDLFQRIADAMTG